MASDNEFYACVLERLFGEVARISSGTDWKNIAAASQLLNRFSARNSVLVAVQARDRNIEVNHLAGYRNWQKLGRQVKKGEKGFSILAPVVAPRKPGAPQTRAMDGADADRDPSPGRAIGFRWVTIFDVSQTEGSPIEGPAPQLLAGESAELDKVNRDLERVVQALGFDLQSGDLGSANGLTDFSSRVVMLKSSLGCAQRAKTLAHEISHVQMHANGIVSRPIAEIEAETSAYLIMADLGLETDSYSFPYITSWSRGDLSLVLRVAERAQECSRATKALIAEVCGSEKICS